jgi:hypothetical protein
VSRRGLVRLVGALAVAAAAVAGAVQVRASTDIGSFTPDGAPSLAALGEQAKDFGGDPITVLLESDQPGQLFVPDTLNRLLDLEGTLAGQPDVAFVLGPATALNQVAIQAQNLLARISGRRDAIRHQAEETARSRGKSPAEAAAAADEASRDFDLRYGGLVVQGLPTGLPTLRNPRFGHTVFFEADGKPKSQWRFLVPSESAIAIQVRPREDLDQSGLERLIARVRDTLATARLPVRAATVTGAPAVTAAVGEQVEREVPLLGSAALVAVTAFFFIARGKRERRRWYLAPVVSVATTLVLLGIAGWAGLTLSVGAIAFLPVLFGVAAFYPLYLATRVRRGTVVVAALASAASFSSLAVSPLPFVRELGLALALGVLVAVGLACVLSRTVEDGPPAAAPEDGATAPEPPLVDGRWRVAVLMVLVIAAGAGIWALPHLDVNADPQRLAAGLPALRDAEHVEGILRASGEVAIVLDGADVVTPEALQWNRAAEIAVLACCGDRLSLIGSPSDLLSFLGRDPTSSEIASALELVPGYLSEAVLTHDFRRSSTFFGLRLQDLGDQAALLDVVRAAIPPVPAGYRFDLVGLPVVAAASYESVSAGRYAGNAIGIAAAGLVLALGLRRRRSDALRAMLAATLATGWGLGLIWLTGQDLTPFTVALGSLTAAVGCEFTVLISQATRPGERAIRRAVVLAVASAATGFLVLVGSELAVMRQFGVFLAGSVLLSYVASRAVVWAFPPRAEVRLEEA